MDLPELQAECRRGREEGSPGTGTGGLTVTYGLQVTILWGRLPLLFVVFILILVPRELRRLGPQLLPVCTQALGALELPACQWGSPGELPRGNTCCTRRGLPLLGAPPARGSHCSSQQSHRPPLAATGTPPYKAVACPYWALQLPSSRPPELFTAGGPIPCTCPQSTLTNSKARSRIPSYWILQEPTSTHCQCATAEDTASCRLHSSMQRPLQWLLGSTYCLPSTAQHQQGSCLQGSQIPKRYKLSCTTVL